MGEERVLEEQVREASLEDILNRGLHCSSQHSETRELPMAVPLPALVSLTDTVLGGKGWVCHADSPWNRVWSYERSDITGKPPWAKSWPQGGRGSVVGSKGAGISPIVLKLIKLLK